MSRLDTFGEILDSHRDWPIVVEFILNHPDPAFGNDYYIGASLEDILEDVKIFSHLYSSYNIMPLKEAEKLGLGLYAEGYAAVMNGCKSFRLMTPKKEQAK